MNQKNQEDWKKRFDHLYEHIDGEKADEVIKQFISEEKDKSHRNGYNSGFQVGVGEYLENKSLLKEKIVEWAEKNAYDNSMYGNYKILLHDLLKFIKTL